MDLQPQVESIVAKLREAVETLAEAVDVRGAGLDPGELERRCRAVGLTIAHDLLALLWPRYGTGIRGRRCAAPAVARDGGWATAPGACTIS